MTINQPWWQNLGHCLAMVARGQPQKDHMQLVVQLVLSSSAAANTKRDRSTVAKRAVTCDQFQYR